MSTLKPLSDAMRKALEALGETPAEHQAQMLAQAKRGKGKPDKPKFQAPSLRPASEIVAAWPEENWLPDARVLFLRQTNCLRCHAQSTAAHWPETFIRQRYRGKPTLYRYLPSRSAASDHLRLPRIVVPVTHNATFCHLCPEWAHPDLPLETPLCLSDSISSQLEPTASEPSSIPLEETVSPSSNTSSDEPLLSPNPPLSTVTVPQANHIFTAALSEICTLQDLASVLVSTAGSPSSVSGSEPHAGATPTSSLTTRDEAPALSPATASL